MRRCPWPIADDPLYLSYHDEEWGVPVRDDRTIFEFLVLESFQAGLSWRTILYKRENFRKAFAGFNPKKVAKFDARNKKQLLNDAGIIRNRLKIESAINNAQKFLEIQKEFDSFDQYVWNVVNGKTMMNRHRDMKTIPAKTSVSDAMSEDMGKRGFKFRGSTICYAFMQAVGMVNDHVDDCWRKKL